MKTVQDIIGQAMAEHKDAVREAPSRGGRMTLHEQIIAEALPGRSQRECPGGWLAIVARPLDGRPVRVAYAHRNDHPSWQAVLWRRAAQYLEAQA